MRAWAARLRYAFGLGLFAALVYVVGPRQLLAVLAGARPGPLAAAAAIYAAMVVVKALRWRLILSRQEIALPLAPALGAYGVGMLWGAVTPGRVGQHFKAAALVARGVRLERAVAGTVVDQLLDFVVIAVLVPVAVWRLGLETGRSAEVAALSLLLAGAGVWLTARFAGERFRQALGEIAGLGRRVIGTPLLLAFLSTSLYFLALDRCGRAVGIEVGVVRIGLATVGAMVVELAPVTVAGLGLREAALLALLGPYGVELGAIIAFTVLVRTMQVVVGALAYGVGKATLAGPRAADVRQPTGERRGA